MLKVLLKDWSPLRRPESFREEVTRWRVLFPDMYDGVIWHAWMPPVRDAIRTWDPTRSEELILFVSCWKSECSPAIWDNIQTQLIIPRLEYAVAKWNPTSDPVRPDVWLLPWLPILGQKVLSSMVSDIRNQIKHVLNRWDAQDGSALMILKPWQSVWSPAQWDQFMIQNIVPKIERYSSRTIVNIQQPDVQPFKVIVRWAGYIPPSQMNRIIGDFLISKWMVNIKLLVNTSLADCAAFYRIFFNVMNENVLALGSVRDHLASALQVMRKKCDERDSMHPEMAPPPKPPKAPDAMDIDDEEDEMPSYQKRPAAETTQDGPPITFKDLVERRAMQRDMIFLPKGRQINGKEIYTIGKLSMYIEMGVCFVSDGAGDWVPTSLNKLFQMA